MPAQLLLPADTGSVGDTGKPRFGCNASLRKELGACQGQNCITEGAAIGQDKLLNLTSGEVFNEGAFQLLQAK